MESPEVNKTLYPDGEERGVNQTETVVGKRHSSIATTQRMQPFDAVANQENLADSGEMLPPHHNPVTAKFGLDRVTSEEALQVIEERSQQNTGSGIQDNVIRGKPNDPYGFIPAPPYNQKVETRDMGVGTNEPVKRFDPEAESNGYDLDDSSQLTIPRNN